MQIPAEAERRFHEAATIAVAELRKIALDGSDAKTAVGRIDHIVANVYVEMVRDILCNIAREEFRRVGREHVRELVLEVVDKVWRNS